MTRFAAHTEQGTPAGKSPLAAAHEFFRKGEANADGWSMLIAKGRGWESAYRDRWRHDKVVRSTHGVNCTGSCSWNVYVKDGLITWESQAVDYPQTDPDRPNHEPRGCPRGASFSWYTYSPVRLKYPYVRGSLLERWRAARATAADPVAAFALVAADGGYRGERGRGGFVRCSWEEATELIAAATVHAIREHGPDRVGGFTPIPAMSPVSFTAGTRFLSLIGGHTTTFYDWYADLPPASPQVFGDQTDVPESADWWDASYLIVWGTNLPITRTPDAHFMTEARYRGQKVVVVSPDYSDHVKFADDWLPAQPGTDGALAMAMGHVMLKEFWVDRSVPRFEGYGKRFTDLPLLVALDERDGAHVPGRFLLASDLGERSEHADFKPVLLDAATGAPAVPNGAVGFRYGEEGKGRWNLELGDLDPVLTLHGRHEELVEVALPRFDVGDGPGGAAMRRGVPAIRVAGRLVTTVLDLMLATYGVAREGLPGEWAADYDDAQAPYTPAWQEAITGVDRRLAVKVAREFARNAEVSGGRSMICMGAGTNHWFHSDETYRSFIALLLLGGCVGINGGGWAHYVGQEKIRTFAGWQQLAFGLDWRRPGRQAQGDVLLLHAHRAVALRPAQARAVRFPARRRAVRGHVGDRRPCQGRPHGLDAVVPAVEPQPARAGRRSRGGRRRPRRARRLRAQGRAAALRGRGPERPGELPARVLRVAVEPARLLGQGPGVLPAPPGGRDPRRAARRAAARGRAPHRGALAR